jgi:hypothetical protein
MDDRKHSEFYSKELGDGRIILTRILGKEILRMGGGWNWLRIVSSGGLWY